MLLAGLSALALGTLPASAAEPAKTVSTPKGTVLADMKGMTLYTFDKDEPGKSNCYETCAKNWPPFMADAGAKASGEWSIVERKDGSRMWAYDGKPLYTFVKDKMSGEVVGDAVGGVWHLAKPD